MSRKKIIRITTISFSLDTLLKGQLSFLNNYYEVVGIASGKKELQKVSKRKIFVSLIFLCPVKLVCGRICDHLFFWLLYSLKSVPTLFMPILLKQACWQWWLHGLQECLIVYTQLLD